MWRGGVSNVVAFPNQSCYLWCKVRVVVFPVAFWDMVLVGVCNYLVEFGNSVINVCDRVGVEYGEMLFCLFCEPLPVGFFCSCSVFVGGG